jgi:Adenylate cyclase, family 3 (some proteins contain HAMP domain)
MARSNWLMARLLASGLSTGAVNEDVRRGDEAYVSEAIDGETFARLLELAYSLDLTAISEQVNVPALVTHQRDDKVVPLEFAKRLASCLANSRFLSVDGDAAVPWHGGSTQEVLDAVIEFCELPLRRDADRKQSHLRTVLFTDLIGHTEMMSRLGDESGRAVLREHERITREILKQYDGTEVKTMGDGFMASFGSVARAVECAVALQQAFARREGESISVRVGLAAGEPIEEDGDLFGATVILASRIAAKAEAGEILVANAVRELCAGKGFLFSDRGEFVAKGFEDPVRLFQAS